MVQRHGTYMTGHALARMAGDNAELLARNYARLEPPGMWPLTFDAVVECHNQARALHGAGVVPTGILGSPNGRGHHTGQALSEGFAGASGGDWLPFECADALDYPVYNYDRVLEVLRQGHGDSMAASWLNGRAPELVANLQPREFRRTVMCFLCERLTIRSPQPLEILTTHFENVLLVHSLCVDGNDLGSVDEAWVPPKNGGVLLYTEHGILLACDYASDYDVVGKPVVVNQAIAFQDR